MSDVIGRLLTIMLMFVFENETDESFDREIEIKVYALYSSGLVFICSSVFTL